MRRSLGSLFPLPARHLVATAAAFLSLGLMSGTAAAQTGHVPVVFATTNPCTGEPFSGSGYVNSRFSVETTPRVHISGEFNTEGFKGATTAGVQYVEQHQNNFHYIFDIPSGAPANYNFEFFTHYIRQGQDPSFPSGDDFDLRWRGHFTVNSNGDVTSDFSDFTINCR